MKQAEGGKRVIHIPKPKFKHDRAKAFHTPATMCASCAYHSPLTNDELEYEKSMRMTRPERHHACHERANVWCKGSVDLQKVFDGIETTE